MIIGLDLGATLGVAYGAAGQAPRLESWRMAKDRGQAYSELEGRLRGFLRREPVEVIAFERPFIAHGNPTANSTARIYNLYGVGALIMKLAYQHDVSCVDHEVRSARKTVIGNGNAKANQIMRSCQSYGVQPANDHEADGFVVWMAACLARKEVAA